MIDFDVQADFKEVNKMLSDMEKSIVKAAANSAINKTLTAVQSKAVRRIAENIGFTKVYGKRRGDAQVKKYLIVKRSNFRTLRASITPNSRKRIPVHKLNAKQTSKGVKYTGLDGKQRFIPDAFIQTIRVKGVPGAYKRVDKDRFPVRLLRTVSISRVMTNAAIKQAIMEVAKERWQKNFQHELNYRLRKYR